MFPDELAYFLLYVSCYEKISIIILTYMFRYALSGSAAGGASPYGGGGCT